MRYTITAILLGLSIATSAQVIKVYDRGIFPAASGYGVIRVFGAVPQYEPEALAFFARMTDEEPEIRKQIINLSIKRLKDSLVWDSIYALQPIAASTWGNGVLNWIGDYCNATINDTTMFSEDIGFTGDILAAYVNTNYAHNDLTFVSATNVQNIMYFRDIGTASSGQVEFGMYTGNNATSHYSILNNASNIYNGRFAGIAFSLVGSTPEDGWFSVRLQGTDLDVINNDNTYSYSGVTGDFSSSIPYAINARKTAAGVAAWANSTASLFAVTRALSDKQYSDFCAIMMDYFEALEYWDYLSVIEVRQGKPETDNYSYINTALSLSDKVLIPSYSDTFEISQPIYLSKKDTLAVNGNIKIKNGTEPTLLTADMAVDDSFAIVTSTAGFNVGEHIAI